MSSKDNELSNAMISKRGGHDFSFSGMDNVLQDLQV